MVRKKVKKAKKRSLTEIVGDYSMAGSRRNDAPGNIRAGRFVRSQRTSVLTDEESEEEKIPRSTRLLVSRPDGKILVVVSTDGRTTLPGGMVESGESDEEGARRELWEETGLIVGDLVKLRTDLEEDLYVTLFRVLSAAGKIKGSEEGEPRWVKPQELLQTEFGEYYNRVLGHLGLL